MSTGLVSKRWLGATLLIALLCLAFIVTPVNAVPIEICDFDDSSSDPWSFSLEPAPTCLVREAEVRNVDFVGDLALMRVAVGDEIESRVYQRTGENWEYLFELAIWPADDSWAVQGAAYEEYARELEDASAEGTQDVGFRSPSANLGVEIESGYAGFIDYHNPSSPWADPERGYPAPSSSERSAPGYEGFIDYHNPSSPWADPE